MAYQRSFLAGMTDYTGVSYEDIRTHLRDWLKLTDESINALRSYREEAEKASSLLENPTEVISYIDYFTDLFSRYRNDFKRLVAETKSEFSTSQIEIVSQIYKSSQFEERVTIRFKNDWVHKTLPHEEMRRLLDNIYAVTRNLLVDYQDLSNLIPRLKTFIRNGSSSTEALSELHLKPNLFGIGINFNRILRRLLEWFRRR